MTRPQLSAAVFGMLLPMMASCSAPPGRYQQATIRDRDGVPCFSVADTPEARANAPLIAGITVMEMGTGGTPIWERIFLRARTTEPALGPDQCIGYGLGGTPAGFLRMGTHYQVEIWGRTPGTPGNVGEAQSRWYQGCFYIAEVIGKYEIRTVESNCSTARSSGSPPVQLDGKENGISR